jgi:hypothetical protein
VAPIFIPIVAVQFTDAYRTAVGKPYSREGIDAIVLGVFSESTERVCEILAEWHKVYAKEPDNAMHATCEDARA